MRRAPACLAILSAVAALAAQGQPSTTATYERPVVTTGGGPQRLAIDAPLLAGGAPFRVIRRGERFYAEDGLNDLRLFVAGRGRWRAQRPAPAYPAAGAGARMDHRSHPSDRGNEANERLRSGSGRGGSRRHDQSRRSARAAPEARLDRGQRRPRPLDDARGRRHHLRFARRATSAECARIHCRAVPLPPRHLERRQQRARAEPVDGRRATSVHRRRAGGNVCERSARTTSERAGHQPLSRAPAGATAADRRRRARRCYGVRRGR